MKFFDSVILALSFERERSMKVWNLLCSDLEVDYQSDENASIVYAALAVDKEVIIHDDQLIHLLLVAWLSFLVTQQKSILSNNKFPF